jgi:hypothetical protein
MSCCVNLVDYIKVNIEYIGKEFNIFLNKILEIDTNSDSKEYNLIDLNEINQSKKKDHVVIDVPISRDYDII